MDQMDKKVREAIEASVRAGINAVGGIDGIRSMSMFPSAAKRRELKRVA
jgi:hypothetical protein